MIGTAPAIRISPLLALAILASGCLSPGPTASDEIPSIEPPALRFLEPREIATYDNMEVESFIESSPDGQTLLTCLHGEFSRPSYMFASQDGGETFRELTAFPTPVAGGDCFVAMSPKGAWSFIHSTGFGTTVATTKDQGGTWTVNPTAAQPINGNADRPWLTYDGERLLLAYMPLIYEPGGIGFTRSDDYGATWTVAQVIVPLDTEYPYIRHGKFLHGPDGAIRIPYVRSTSSNAGENEGSMKLAFAVSRDRGLTWTQEPVRTMEAASATSTGAAQSDDGTLFWPYYKPANGSLELRALVSIDDGAAWTDHLVAQGLASARVWWGDGRPGASADVTFLSDGVHAGDDGPHVAIARLDLEAGALDVSIAKLRAYADGLEYVGVDHDGTGRAFVVIPEPGFRITTLGHLHLVAEDQGT